MTTPAALWNTPATPLTAAQARTLIATAQEHARQLGIAITVAIVDEGGALLTLERMDGAPPLSAQIAEAKAVGSAVTCKDGTELVALHERQPGFFAAIGPLARLPLVPGDGALVLREGDRVLGAVGISGATGAEDRECAEAGIRAALGS